LAASQPAGADSVEVREALLSRHDVAMASGRLRRKPPFDRFHLVVFAERAGFDHLIVLRCGEPRR